MLQKMVQTIQDNDLLMPGQPVLAALSGGADSVALLLALHTLGYPLRALHVNHQLRAAEAEHDAAFAEALCARLKIPFVLRKITVAQKQGESVETAARRLRYQVLDEAATANEKIATAHTADDQLETILYHLARGSGLDGLCGIPVKRGNIIRPMLSVTEQEIRAFLKATQQEFVQDSTNEDLSYTRNYIRHVVVPDLQKINPSAVVSAVRMNRLLRQDQAFLDEQAQICFAACLQSDGSLRGEDKLPPAMQTRVLRLFLKQCGVPMGRITERQITALQLLRCSKSPSARAALPDGYTVYREYDRLVLRKTEEAVLLQLMTVQPPCVCDIAGNSTVTFEIKENSSEFNNSFNTFWVDCDTIDFRTLVVRSRQSGDRICVNKKSGSKSLKRLMIEKKIPQRKRDCLAVVADSKGVVAVQSLGVEQSRLGQGTCVLEIQFKGEI